MENAVMWEAVISCASVKPDFPENIATHIQVNFNDDIKSENSIRTLPC